MQAPKPLTIFGQELIEQSAIDQMNVALSIPVALAGALMPDAHLGYALPNVVTNLMNLKTGNIVNVG